MKTPKEIVIDLWCKACEFDGIEPEASFVVFSDQNPWVERYNVAMAQYLQACRSVQVG